MCRRLRRAEVSHGNAGRARAGEQHDVVGGVAVGRYGRHIAHAESPLEGGFYAFKPGTSRDEAIEDEVALRCHAFNVSWPDWNKQRARR